MSEAGVTESGRPIEAAAGKSTGKYQFARFHPKLLDCLKDYTPELLAKDMAAGVTVGVLALPLAIAFAIASGCSPTAGIWTAIVAGFLISLLGGSRVQIGGPTGAFIPIVFGIVSIYGFQNLMVATMIAGILLFVMGLTKMGVLIRERMAKKLRLDAKGRPVPLEPGKQIAIALERRAAQTTASRIAPNPTTDPTRMKPESCAMSMRTTLTVVISNSPKPIQRSSASRIDATVARSRSAASTSPSPTTFLTGFSACLSTRRSASSPSACRRRWWASPTRRAWRRRAADARPARLAAGLGQNLRTRPRE